MSKLTPKQELFIQEYMKDLNATQAAKRAGYSERTAYRTGADLLKKPQIVARIEKMKADRAKRNQIDADWVLQNFIKVAQMSMKAEPVMTFDYESKEMVETGEYQFDSTGANKALENIGKHIGFFDNKHKLTAAQIEKIKAETELTKERIKLLKGDKGDTALIANVAELFKAIQKGNGTNGD
ncbi:terminase small subunit [Bacillus sp. WMMC1349]|uniref:terminase small subunit n=1 Tax=Bacillus sp. WMMC1349 TaxID=2736254 RepID=UPI001556FD8B|nr:terminase small subunit [Bacillus sp. WMMC1349]NPC91212.1 terminase small subunit [Bacillus sp. WMMC1349]